MAIEKERTTKCRGPHNMMASRVFALLLIICLVECTSGSCLSYGHSCWGAHGKRSGKPPAAAPDWFLTRLLRRMAVNTEINNENQAPTRNDLNTIFQGLSGEDAPSTDRLANNNDGPIELPFSRNLEAKPMLDEDVISKIKMWQIMKESSEEK